MVAVLHGEHEVMCELVEHGANVDAVNPTGQTALWYARMVSDEEAVRILIAGGARAEGVPADPASEGDLKQGGAVAGAVVNEKAAGEAYRQASSSPARHRPGARSARRNG